MKTVKEKLYSYEETPPAEAWNAIAGAIGQSKIVPMRAKRRTVFFAIAAAAVICFLAINFIFFNQSDGDHSPQDTQTTALTADNSSTQKDSIKKNNEVLEKIIKAPESKKLVASSNLSDLGFHKKYITVCGPEGQPVKISPKAATLIVSANNEYPPKPVWDKKIDKWQHIMLTNSLSSSATNLMDIIQEASNSME